MDSDKTTHDVISPGQETSLNNIASETQGDTQTKPDLSSPSPEDTTETMRPGVLKIAAGAVTTLFLLYLLAPTVLNLILWNFESLLLGDISTDTVFDHRLHAYVTDDLHSCYVPWWIPEGTLITAREGCEAPDGWEVRQLPPDMNVPSFMLALDSCSRGERMLCLIISNSQALPFGPRHKKDALQQLTRQTLSLYTNEDYSWACNKDSLSACQVVPGGSAQCILEAMTGLPFEVETDKQTTWAHALSHCKINPSYIQWGRG